MKPFTLEWWKMQEHKVILEIIDSHIAMNYFYTCYGNGNPPKKIKDRYYYLWYLQSWIAKRIINKYGEQDA